MAKSETPVAGVGCILFIAGVYFIITAGIELHGKLKFNDNLKSIETNVTHYDIHKETTEYSFYVYGSFYIDFPEFDSSFEICHDKGYDKSIKECKKYLERYYPIGKPTSIYYNPDNISDSRLEKINNDWLIVGVTFLCLLICCSCCCFIGGCIENYNDQKAESFRDQHFNEKSKKKTEMIGLLNTTPTPV